MAEVKTTTKDMSFEDVMATIDLETTPGNQGILRDLDIDHPVFDESTDKDKDKETKDKDKDKENSTKEKVEDKDKDKDKDKEKDKDAESKGKVDEVLDNEEEEDKEKDKDKKSSFTITKSIGKLIEDKKLLPFDEDKKLDEYTDEDVIELLVANLEHTRQEVLNKEIPEFFQSLPEEIQFAAQYVANGGQDLKGLFKALAATEEIKELDIKTPKGQESIVREYYRAMEWSDEDVDEEIEKLKELGDKEMEKKAAKFQPKLQKLHEEVVQGQLVRQASERDKQEKETKTYLTNALETIKPAKLGDIKLDRKTQATLYQGLSQMNYQTRKGSPTNELGMLLEKYQFVEPNFDKVYKALWLLRDEEGFFEAFGRKIENKVNADTARKLRTGQEQSSSSVDDEPKETKAKTKGLTRPSKIPSFMEGLKG